MNANICQDDGDIESMTRAHPKSAGYDPASSFEGIWGEGVQRDCSEGGRVKANGQCRYGPRSGLGFKGPRLCL